MNFTPEAMKAEYERGRRDERAAVVAWLSKRAKLFWKNAASVKSLPNMVAHFENHAAAADEIQDLIQDEAHNG